MFVASPAVEIDISEYVCRDSAVPGINSAVPGIHSAVLGTRLAAAVACALGERVLGSLEAPIARQEALATWILIGRPRGAQRMLRAAGGRVARPR